jgi:hypothetical protein
MKFSAIPQSTCVKWKQVKLLSFFKQIKRSLNLDLASLSGKQLRPFGLCAGAFTVSEDFDEPLPEEILSAFEGK